MVFGVHRQKVLFFCLLFLISGKVFPSKATSIFTEINTHSDLLSRYNINRDLNVYILMYGTIIENEHELDTNIRDKLVKTYSSIVLDDYFESDLNRLVEIYYKLKILVGFIQDLDNDVLGKINYGSRNKIYPLLHRFNISVIIYWIHMHSEIEKILHNGFNSDYSFQSYFNVAVMVSIACLGYLYQSSDKKGKGSTNKQVLGLNQLAQTVKSKRRGLDDRIGAWAESVSEESGDEWRERTLAVLQKEDVRPASSVSSASERDGGILRGNAEEGYGAQTL